MIYPVRRKDGTVVQVNASSPAEAASVVDQMDGASTPPSPIVSRAGAPATIGPTPRMDRDIVSGRNLLGKDSTLTMRDVIEAAPNAMSMAAPLIPGGAVARIAGAGVLGLAGGGIRDLIRKALGEQPTASVGEKLITDALPSVAGQGLGEVASLAGKALPKASSAGMSQAAKDLHIAAGPLSDAPLAQMYSRAQQHEGVFKGWDEFKGIRGKLVEADPAPMASRPEVGARMAEVVGQGSSAMRKRLGTKFDALEKPLSAQSVDVSSSLDAARDLPDSFKGVKAVERVLGAGEIPAQAGNVRVVQAPFKDVRDLSKGSLTKVLRGKLEGDIESHISQNAPGKLAEYQGLKADWKSKVGDLFDRGVVAKVFKDPQKLEEVFNVPGSSPDRLRAVKAAIDSHPDPATSTAVWNQFRRAKFDQLMSGGPTQFSKRVGEWAPESLDIVFGPDAKAVVRFKELTDAMASNPQQAKAFTDLIMSGKPPTYNLGGGTGQMLKAGAKSGVRAVLGGAAGAAVGAPVAAGAFAGEAAGNLYGLAQNVIAHNPEGGLSTFVNAVDSVLKSGRTGSFWNMLAASSRVGRAKRKHQGKPQEEPK